MSQMNYFRRPQLAGKQVRRLTYASVRGNQRRSDPDATSTMPYYPDITPGNTLTVQTQVGQVSIPLTSSSYNQIIADLNNIGVGLPTVNAVAFDDGGCVGIRSKTSGQTGWVKIVGGTGAAALGFDVSKQAFRSVGGDVPGAGEGLVSQPFGTVLPNRGEDLQTDSFNRALARIMSNSDVLYADVMRDDVALKKLGTVVGAKQTTINVQTVSPGTRVFTAWQPSGTPVLTPAATPEDLARFYILVDADRKRLCQSRVIDVVDSGGSSLLGVEEVLTNAAIITGIYNNRVVECSAADFQIQGVQVGHYAKITGAQNTDQWDNNGFKWVVEEVVDQTHVALRPMSRTELALLCPTGLIDEQPMLELNGDRSGNQSFGSLVVSGGPWTTRAYLKVSPPLPSGMNVEVWASQPVSRRSREVSGSRNELTPITGHFVKTDDVVPNGLLTKPSVAAVTSGFSVTEFLARWHGRAVRVPASGNVTPGDGTWYVYWDEITAQLAWTTNASNVFPVDSRAQDASPAAAKGKIIAVAVVAGTSCTLTYAAKVSGEDTISLTVGYGAQFSKLEEALAYVQQVAQNTTATTRISAEIIITSDLTTSGVPWVVQTSASIRGAHPGVKLLHGAAGSLFTLGASVLFHLSTVTIDLTKNTFGSIGAGSKTFVKDVTHLDGSDRRTIDSNDTIDIGAGAPGVLLGRNDTTETKVRNRLHLTRPSIVDDKLTFTKAAEADVDLTKTDIDNLHAQLPSVGEKAALAGTGTPSGANKFITNDDARIPTQGENDALTGTAGTPGGTNQYVTNSDGRIPTSSEKSALVGTSGTPGPTNKFVTDADGRLTNSRAPTAHAASHIGGGGDAIAIAVPSGAAGLLSGSDKAKLDGIADNANNYSLPAATSGALGGVKIDTVGLSIDGAGLLGSKHNFVDDGGAGHNATFGWTSASRIKARVDAADQGILAYLTDLHNQPGTCMAAAGFSFNGVLAAASVGSGFSVSFTDGGDGGGNSWRDYTVSWTTPAGYSHNPFAVVVYSDGIQAIPPTVTLNSCSFRADTNGGRAVGFGIAAYYYS